MAIFGDDFPDEVGVKVMEFLEVEELNDATLVSHRFQNLRNSPVLDQTRINTIRILGPERSTRFTVQDFIRKIPSWRPVFQRHRSQLRIAGIEHIGSAFDFDVPGMRLFEEELDPEFHLAGVSSLDISVDHPTEIGGVTLWIIALMVPNLEKLTLDYARVRERAIVCRLFLQYSPNLRCLSWEARQQELSHNQRPELHRLGRYLCRVRELYLKGATIRVGNPKNFPNLERIDLSRVSCCVGGSEVREISQATLLSLVRNTPNLKWFCSDLTAENIETLQRERPDMTFARPDN